MSQGIQSKPRLHPSPNGREKQRTTHLAHIRLDEAVFAAHGWKPDLSDEEILSKLLALNFARA